VDGFLKTRRTIMAKHMTVAVYLCLLGACAGVNAAGDAVRGKLLYETQCGACHSIDHNLIGPAHKGVYGRKAGSVADYSYSDAVKSANVVWSERTLDLWLSDPEKLIPGQAMNFSVSSAQERADIIAYLKKESAPLTTAGSPDGPGAARTGR
jgi:cytochrome c